MPVTETDKNTIVSSINDIRSNVDPKAAQMPCLVRFLFSQILTVNKGVQIQNLSRDIVISYNITGRCVLELGRIMYICMVFLSHVWTFVIGVVRHSGKQSSIYCKQLQSIGSDSEPGDIFLRKTTTVVQHYKKLVFPGSVRYSFR